MSAADPVQVNCPTCRTLVRWCAQHPQRPFCSQRCKDSDFIAWAQEEQRIPGAPVYAELSPGIADWIDS